MKTIENLLAETVQLGAVAALFGGLGYCAGRTINYIDKALHPASFKRSDLINPKTALIASAIFVVVDLAARKILEKGLGYSTASHPIAIASRVTVVIPISLLLATGGEAFLELLPQTYLAIGLSITVFILAIGILSAYNKLPLAH